MSTENIDVITDICGLIISFAGFLVVIIQLFRVDKSLKSSARGSIFDMSSRIKEIFLSKPYLRQYFFDGKAITIDHEHYQEALAVADYYCLYLEQITTQKSNIDKVERDSWLKYVHDIYHDSPIIKEYLKDKREWYSPKFWEVINGTL